MQAWMFVGSRQWMSENVSKALATSVPTGRLLFLDLYAEEYPIYRGIKSYHGQPFLWCMLHNFGGKLGMYGMVERVNQVQHYSRLKLVLHAVTVKLLI